MTRGSRGERLKLAVAGPDSVLASALCATCPHSPAGCCVAPPRYDWSDLGRVVAHGGGSWLLEQIARKRLLPVAHGFAIRREKRRISADPGAPRLAKCTFHDGASGCTIDPRQRPATCNFYLCESALIDAEEQREQHDAARARALHDQLVADFVRWDQELDARVRAEWPVDTRATPAFFEWLATQLEQLRAGA